MTNSQIPLPAPDERPESIVVIYDGQCQFCRGQVERLQRWDGRKQLSFLSLHDPAAEVLLPQVTKAQLLEQMYVVEPGGQFFGGAAAIRYLSRRLPRLWWLAPLLYIPGTLPLWQWVYALVARRRYRLSGTSCDSGRCSIHKR